MPSFRSFTKQLYTTILPDRMRYPLDIASISIRDILINWHLPVYRIHALLPESHSEGTVLYLGNLPQYKTWTHKLFGKTTETTFIGHFSLFQILSGKSSVLATADLTLCPLNPWTMPLFAHFGWNTIPLYVNCHLDLNKPIDELYRSKGVKEDLRIARRLGYRFDFLKDDEAIHEFFHQMLIPTAKLRHEERAFLSQWENIKNTFYNNGILLAAYLEDQWAGGILIALEGNDTIRLANMGWRNGNKQWRKKGLVAALFNQSFIWARENGYKYVNLGSSNPFANDGSLNFKLKWGAILSVPELIYVDNRLEGARSFIGVKLNLKSQATQSFLTTTPLIEFTKGKLRAIGWNAEIPPLFHSQLDKGCSWFNLAETHDKKIY